MPRPRMQVNKKYNNMLTGIVLKYMCIHDVEVPELAVTLCMSNPTVYARLKNPERLTIGQLRKMCTKLKIPQEEILPAVMGGE